MQEKNINNNLLLIIYLDLKESIRSKWFLIYFLVFGGLMALFFITGVSESQIMGFSGLSRTLLMYIQITIIILPIFILITTTRSISSDKENNILEYMLSFPISLKSYYWGKFIARFITVFFPVLLAMIIAIIYGATLGAKIPWDVLVLYTALLFSLSLLFLGISFLISSIVRSTDIALGTSFFIWILLLAFIDIALIGIMLQNRFDDGIIIFIALLNPIEIFRIGAISIFDPSLSVIGPVAFYILDNMSRNIFILFAVLYPISLGCIFAYFGFSIFKKKDLI